ncbi:hypothetical protein ACE1CM_19170 [Microseira sp. BLCC-F43]
MSQAQVQHKSNTSPAISIIAPAVSQAGVELNEFIRSKTSDRF